MNERLTTEDFASPEKRTTAQAGYDQGQTGYDREPLDNGPAGHDRDQTGGEHARYDDEPVYETGTRDASTDETITDSPRTDEPAVDDRTYDEPTADQPTADQPTADEPVTGTPTADARTGSAQSADQSPRSDDEPLFTSDEADGYQVEWRALQADFVDDPRDAVQRADELVAQVIQSLATTFSEHKRSLEGQWQEGGQADTEELRLALRRYRSFFDRLLSV
ncbi:hypothetical protein FHS29_006634 [Saccharothrix tamanrassetensis]|uniref:Uncharacterized protein n=1 Tax=Saccharothrix tamanrassetensis TaxID=1051531 RepID=A0A841CNH8_9PSEU|nr:hypothetical protein [Saccharothrix tamanrassetensis]MBB5960012.1 hypothetical protein [Saccharothrix tamanrassetensis]